MFRKETDMKKLIKFWSFGFLVTLVVTSGCMTWTAKTEDMSDIYRKPTIANAPKIVITDLSDERNDKKLVGRISALNLATQTPINVIITNRIALKLREAGFNIQKIELAGLETKSELIATLKRNSGKMLFTGRLEHFFIESSDAILETAKGRASFRVDILDESGKSLFYRTYTAHAQKHIGLGGGPGSEELIKETIQATVNKLFHDIEFQRFLSEAKDNSGESATSPDSKGGTKWESLRDCSEVERKKSHKEIFAILIKTLKNSTGTP